MNSEVQPSVRLYAILARERPVAVVFRRGPSKQVQLVFWLTDQDKFHEGQWLKGRIYERRCDLSPSGKRLIYFAANYKEPFYSWTAISKPPFFTALALWPKGDGWGGGGLFVNEKEVLLNHRNDEMKLAAGFQLPKWVKVKPFGEHSGQGEDEPIATQRLIRDGWKIVQEANVIERSFRAPIWLEFDPPEIWSKANPLKKRKYELRMITKGIHARGGPWYVMDYLVADKTSETELTFGRTDWADWCHSGDLLFAQNGKIFRLGFNEDGKLLLVKNAKLLINLNDRTFEPKEAPDEAKAWREEQA